MGARWTFLAATLLSIALPAVGGFGQEKAAEEPAAKSPWQLDKAVESWYKITAGGKHVGFMHTRIQPEGGGYAYTFEIDAGLKVKNEIKPIGYTGVATMDKGFVPLTLQSTLAVGARSITFSMVTVAGIRKITGEEIGGEKRSTQKFILDDDDEIFCDLQSGLFAMKAKGELEKPESRRGLKVAVPNSAEPYQKAAVLVKSGVTREYLGKMAAGVECGFEEPFSIVPGFPVASLTVDGYGRILEILGAGDEYMTIAIVEDSVKAKPHPETIIQKRSRSPFDKNLAMSQKNQQPKMSPGAETPEKIDDAPIDAKAPTVEGKILELNKIVDEMEANPSAEEKLKQLSALFTATRSELLKLTKAEAVLKGVRELTGRALKCYDPGPRIRDQAKQAREHVEKVFRTEKVPALREQLRKIQESANDPTLIGRTDLIQEIKKYAAEAEQFVDRAARLVDLRAKKPVISGILYHLRDESIPLSFNISVLGYGFDYAQSVYFPVPNSYAIVNGKTVQEGEIVEGCQVRRILEDGIVLGDKGEEVFFEFKIRVK